MFCLEEGPISGEGVLHKAECKVVESYKNLLLLAHMMSTTGLFGFSQQSTRRMPINSSVTGKINQNCVQIKLKKSINTLFDIMQARLFIGCLLFSNCCLHNFVYFDQARES